MLIRDLDQRVMGKPHDLIRLGVSVASAMRGANLSSISTARMIEQMIDGYEGAFVEESGKAESPPETIDLIVKTATRRTWKGLAKERIENTKPSIPLGRSFWLCSKPNELDNLIASESVRDILTSTLTRQEDVAVTVADAAF